MACGSWYEHVQGWWEKKQEKQLLCLFYEDMKKVRVGWRGGRPGCTPSPSLFGSLPVSAIPQDLQREVQKILRFLGKEVSEGTVARILHHTSFQEMRKNPAADYVTMPTALTGHSPSPFLRKGGVWPAVEGSGGGVPVLYCTPIRGCKYPKGVRLRPARFLARGSSGDWKNHFAVAPNERFDQRYREHRAGSDLRFQMEPCGAHPPSGGGSASPRSPGKEGGSGRSILVSVCSPPQ